MHHREVNFQFKNLPKNKKKIYIILGSLKWDQEKLFQIKT